jgi:hypothetical protein
MSELYEIVRQDFAAAALACNEGEYSLMNVYSNRLMGNCVFGDRKEFGLIGYFLKEIAIDFLKLGTSSESQNALKPIASALISKLNAALKPELDLASAWDGYFAYVDSSRKLFVTDVEKKTYRDDKAFTASAVSTLARQFLRDEALFQESGQLLKGILSECERLIRNHGAEDRDIVFSCLVTALDRLTDYLKLGSPINQDAFKSAITPYLIRLTDWTAANEGAPFSIASDILSDVLLEWRRSFVRYTEIGRVTATEERKIELPLEAKKRLGDTIAEALKKDLVQKKPKGRR